MKTLADHQYKPYHWYAVPVFILVILGLADSIYLCYLHYKNYTDISFSSFCAISKAVNCDTVSQSPWSILWGLPIAFWGVFAYCFYLLIFILACRKPDDSKNLWYVLVLLGIGYSTFSFYLGYVSSTQIKAYCILCLFSYFVSFSLLFMSIIIAKRFCTLPLLHGLKFSFSLLLGSRFFISGAIVLCLFLTALIVWLPQYWRYSADNLEINTELSTGMTDEGNPWIGSENPQITIHEYTDYQCFQCSKNHLFLRRLIAENPDKIRLVHHHYPMDHEFNNIVVPTPYHVGSGKMAMLAIYAASVDKFWEMNDILYELGRTKQSFNTKTLEEKTGIPANTLAMATKHPQIKKRLLYDIRKGMKLNITGTPSYVIDGEMYESTIPVSILKDILD